MARHWDVVPGTVVRFTHNPTPRTQIGWEDERPEVGTWLVIGRRVVRTISSTDIYEYLMLGPGPSLRWLRLKWWQGLIDPRDAG